MYKIELRTPDLSISNFSSNVIRKSVYQLANCAEFVADDKDFKNLKTIKKALKKDMNVKVLIDGDLALSGYIAALDYRYLEKKPYLSAKINTYAGRMVGASIGKGLFFTQVKIGEIINQVVSGFAVEFINQSQSDVVLPYYAISPTDKIENILTDLARLSDTLIYSDDNGRLVMTDKCRDKHSTSALVTGENIINVYKNDDVYKAFSDVALQSQLPLNDAISLENIINTSLSGKSKGENRCYCRTVAAVSPQRLSAEVAELEYDCYDLRVTGSSFRATDDKLYQLNTALRIKDDWLEINDSFLITDICLSSDFSGCRASLNLEEMA